MIHNECMVCHRDFRAVGDFEVHRVGPAEDRRCLTGHELSEMGLYEVDGVWANEASHLQAERMAERMLQVRQFRKAA